MPSAELHHNLHYNIAREFGSSVDIRPTPKTIPFPVMGCVAPHSEAAAYELMDWCGKTKQALVSMGGRTRLHIGAPPSQPVILFSTEYLTQVLDWDEGNATVEAQAGITLHALNALVAGKRQFVPLDDARNGSESTLGGAVAANAWGPAKLKWGAPRDLVTGLHASLSDGRVVKAGAKVVKNVAGYDLPKLFTGSWGNLGVLTRVTLRLRAQDTARLRWECPVADWREANILCHTILNGAFEPTWICAAWNGQDLRVAACFDGGEAALRAQHQRLPNADGASEVSEGDSVLGAPPYLRPSLWELRATLPLAHSGAWAEQCVQHGAQQIMWDAGTGTVRASWQILQLRSVQQLRAAAHAAGGFVVVERAPRELQTADMVWGEVPASFALMRGLKAKFDPQSVCAPGRYVGGL